MDVVKIRIVDIGMTDPYANLALEEYLFHACGAKEAVLFLWQNENAVVLGRNQNVYTQCNLRRASEYGTKVCRRKSGGGAVYHDMGNLNYTFIVPYDTDWKETTYGMLLELLSQTGIEAGFSGRNDLVCDGRKVSGNAYYMEDNKICHHGTLLVDADVERMTALLSVDREKWTDKGIDSVRSRVVNLSELQSGTEITLLKQLLKETFISTYGDVLVSEWNRLEDVIGEGQASYYSALYAKYSSDQWNYGKSIQADFTVKRKFRWGIAEIRCSVENGFVKEMQIATDSLETDIFLSIAEEMTGKRFVSEEFGRTIRLVKKRATETLQYNILEDLENILTYELQ